MRPEPSPAGGEGLIGAELRVSCAILGKGHPSKANQVFLCCFLNEILNGSSMATALGRPVSTAVEQSPMVVGGITDDGGSAVAQWIPMLGYPRHHMGPDHVHCAAVLPEGKKPKDTHVNQPSPSGEVHQEEVCRCSARKGTVVWDAAVQLFAPITYCM